MATYLILNILFIVAIILFLRIPVSRPGRKILIVTGLLLGMTIIFDSLIVGMGIVGYDTAKTLSVYIGAAPIEDLFYSVLAVIVIPYLWNFFGEKK